MPFCYHQALKALKLDATKISGLENSRRGKFLVNPLFSFKQTFI